MEMRWMLLVMDILGLAIRNKKKFITLLCISIIALIAFEIYYTYYFIDFHNYSEIKYNGTYLSPNKRYSIRISILIPRKNKNEYYILGELIKNEFITENNQIIDNNNTRIIYWDKQKGKFLKKNIYVKWINNIEFQIENKKIRIDSKGYDYRRNSS